MDSKQPKVCFCQYCERNPALFDLDRFTSDAVILGFEDEADGELPT